VRNIRFYDTTLRDGEQGIGFTMTSEQKLMALPVLDAIGLDVIEFGMVTDDAAADLFSRAAQLAPQSCVSALSRLRQDEVARTVKALRVKPSRFSRTHHGDHANGSIPRFACCGVLESSRSASPTQWDA